MSDSQSTPECEYFDVLFDGPPSHESGRFVEVESPAGTGVKYGEWIDRGDGYWALRFPKGTSPAVVGEAVRAESVRKGMQSEIASTPKAWMNAEGLLSIAPGGGYDTPLFARSGITPPSHGSAAVTPNPLRAIKGWRLVPEEPTAEMMRVSFARGAAGEYNEGIWKAMLAVAPFAESAAASIDELHKMLDEAEVSRKRSMDAGATWQEYTLAERFKIVLGANRMMERELDEKAEVEARCCPEDYGFEEWVGVLEKRDNVVAHRHLQELVSLLLQARDPIGPMRDRGDYPVELQRAIDFLHGRGSPSATAYPLPWSPEETAMRFHKAYEEFAPLFGYATRPDTRTFDPNSANGKLMIAVVRNVLIEQAAADRNLPREG